MNAGSRIGYMDSCCHFHCLQSLYFIRIRSSRFLISYMVEQPLWGKNCHDVSLVIWGFRCYTKAVDFERASFRYNPKNPTLYRWWQRRQWIYFRWVTVFCPWNYHYNDTSSALGTDFLRLKPKRMNEGGLGEIFCSVYVVLLYMPFMLGFFRKGKYGIPLSTIWKSAALALGFLQLCKMSSRA